MQSNTTRGFFRSFLARSDSVLAKQYQIRHSVSFQKSRASIPWSSSLIAVRDKNSLLLQQRAFSASSGDSKARKPSWWDKPNDSSKEKAKKNSENDKTVDEAPSTKRSSISSSLRKRGRGRIFSGSSRRQQQTSNAQNGKDAMSNASGNTSLAKLNNQIDSIRAQYVPYLPEVLLVPHNDRPLFPGLNYVSSFEFSGAQKALFDALSEIKASDKPYIGLFKEKDLDEEDQNSAYPPSLNRDSFHDVGVLAEIIDLRSIQDDNAQVDFQTPYTKVEVIDDTVEKEETVKDSLENGFRVFLKAHRRIGLDDIIENGPPLRAKIDHIDEPDRRNYDQDILQGYAKEITSTISGIIKLNPIMHEHAGMIQVAGSVNMTWPGLIADFAAAYVAQANPVELQEVLDTVDLDKRLERVLILLKKELQSGQVQSDINRKVDEKIGANQRRYVLMERLKEIKKELGMETDDKEGFMSKFRNRVIELNKVEPGIPMEAQNVIDEELSKMETLEKNSAEFHMSRSYLEWLTCLPWTYFSKDNFDLLKASEVLDRDHYGLKDVKERILEFIAVGNLRGSVQGKILLLVGPPGVGKTSIGKSIAEALDRKFYRFSVGGLSDVSEIKGHRRTYVGAMPGKMIQCLKTTNVSNPLVLVDEIDKMGTGIRGDPASALLELLDPSQNTSFMDHYLDVPFDASKVLFVCTANTTDTIPGPLLDRMEVIRLSGYDLPEKVAIAQQYLEPRAKLESGVTIAESKSESSTECKNSENKNAEPTAEEIDKIKKVPSTIKLETGAIEALARWYCREAGVRKLEQHIERIYRKMALKVLRATEEELNNPEEWTISETQLSDYVGKPQFTSDRLFETPPPGVVMGLAWTNFGGSALYIESTNLKNANRQTSGDETTESRKVDGGFFVTGQLGDVMKESTRIALTHAKHKLQEIAPQNDFFEVNQIHMHTPEGATPKDGPSAGVTMTTALLSLAQNRAVSPDLAMTGELSLTGMVLPVGGIKEKVIAARRSGVKIIILPDENRRDVDELADYLKEGVSFYFAKTYDDVYKVAFPELD
mmetsp:Transcript_15778/g.17813  ORF Transcript_15778/g.17813 Transcript_15778/m.17813 type:complete len:1051 (+) Transcript_15778:210-3362(+)